MSDPSDAFERAVKALARGEAAGPAGPEPVAVASTLRGIADELETGDWADWELVR